MGSARSSPSPGSSSHRLTNLLSGPGASDMRIHDRTRVAAACVLSKSCNRSRARW